MQANNGNEDLDTLADCGFQSHHAAKRKQSAAVREPFALGATTSGHFSGTCLQPSAASRFEGEFMVTFRDARETCIAKISLAAKAGEFVQGVTDGMPGEIPATVSAGPFYTKAEVTTGCPLHVVASNRTDTQTTRRSLEAFVRVYQIPLEQAGRVLLNTNVPTGKGLASSSLDATAAVLAMARAHGIGVSFPEFYRQLCTVERSDPVWSPNTLMFARQAHGIYQALGAMPPMLMIGWDGAPHGVVNTHSVANVDAQRATHASKYQDLFAMVATRNAYDIMDAATESACLNQRYLPKRDFWWAKKLAAGVGGGLVVAHSGTYLGILLPPNTSAQEVGSIRLAIAYQGRRPLNFQMGGASS